MLSRTVERPIIVCGWDTHSLKDCRELCGRSSVDGVSWSVSVMSLEGVERGASGRLRRVNLLHGSSSSSERVEEDPKSEDGSEHE